MWYIERSTPYGFPKLPESVSFISNDGIVVEYVPRRFCKDAQDAELAWRLRFECSECGGMSLEIAPRYCPRCGAEVLQ